MPRRRRCRNCPEDWHGLSPPVKSPPQPKTFSPSDLPKGPGGVLTYESEAAKLWQHAIYASATLAELLFGYVATDMPGDPLPAMRRLHARLGEIIQIREERTK